jgi:hypothetical protein
VVCIAEMNGPKIGWQGNPRRNHNPKATDTLNSDDSVEAIDSRQTNPNRLVNSLVQTSPAS